MTYTPEEMTTNYKFIKELDQNKSLLQLSWQQSCFRFNLVVSVWKLLQSKRFITLVAKVKESIRHRVGRLEREKGREKGGKEVYHHLVFRGLKSKKCNDFR
jgi:hypothetical protein